MGHVSNKDYESISLAWLCLFYLFWSAICHHSWKVFLEMSKICCICIRYVKIYWLNQFRPELHQVHHPALKQSHHKWLGKSVTWRKYAVMLAGKHLFSYYRCLNLSSWIRFGIYRMLDVLHYICMRTAPNATTRFWLAVVTHWWLL